MPRKLFPVIIHADGAGNFGASFVDLPIHAGGLSVEDALAEAEAIAAEVVSDMLKAGDDLPTPTTVAAIPEEDRASAALIALVGVHLPGKSRALSITLDEDLIERIDAVASNRSAFLAEAARARLGG